MKNRYFIFNGINSIDNSIILKNHPIISSPPIRDDSIIIDGRSGSLHYNKDIYDIFVKTLECSIIDSNKDIREITSWLKGTGKIIFSNELDKYYNVNIINQIDFTNIADQMHEFPLVIEFQPLAYSTMENIITISENMIINIKKSNTKVYPRLKVYGEGDITITINNKSQILYNVDEFIELDSELEIAYKNNSNKNSSVYGEYLTLNPGDNNISFLGLVSKIELIYRDTYI